MQPGQSAGKRATSAKGEAPENIQPAPNAKRGKTNIQRQMSSAGKRTSSVKCQACEKSTQRQMPSAGKHTTGTKCQARENTQYDRLPAYQG